MLQDMKPCMFWLEGLERRKHHLPVPTNQTIENTTTTKNGSIQFISPKVLALHFVC